MRGANIAQMVNVLQAMIFTDAEKMVLTPTYHVFHMYVPFQEATTVPVEYAAGSYKVGDVELPRLDVIAARDSQGKLWVALANLDAKRAAPVDVAVPGRNIVRAEGRMLAAPKVDSVNTFDAPAVVAPKTVAVKAAGQRFSVKLAPASVTVIGLE